jgi:hypothetical protein
MEPGGLSDNPAGRLPDVIDHVYPPDPPVAESVWEYAVPAVPSGREEVEIVIAALLMFSERDLVADPPAVSAARKVNWTEPAADGVPLTTPLAVNDKPAGSAPLVTDQVYDPFPPVAVKFCEYATPIVPSGSELVEIDIRELLMSRLRIFVADPPAVSAARTVKLADTGADGVPPMTPAGVNERPAGRDPLLTDHVYEPVPPVAAKACE